MTEGIPFTPDKAASGKAIMSNIKVTVSPGVTVRFAGYQDRDFLNYLDMFPEVSIMMPVLSRKWVIVSGIMC